MKRIVVFALIGVFALYFYEQKTGRNLYIGSSLQGAASIVDNAAGTSFSSGVTGGFAGGYGAATRVGGSVSGGAGGLASGVSGNMGAVFGN